MLQPRSILGEKNQNEVLFRQAHILQRHLAAKLYKCYTIATFYALHVGGQGLILGTSRGALAPVLELLNESWEVVQW